MSTTAILHPARELKTYLPGLEPDALFSDPVLKVLSGKRLAESTIRRHLGLAPRVTRKKGKTRPVAPPLSPARPLFAAHCEQKGGYYLPDAVVDTEAKRERDKVEPLARLEKLAEYYPDGLKLYRLTLSELDKKCLYDPATVNAARRFVRRWLRERHLRGEWKLERGRYGGTHVHIVTCASADSSGVKVHDLNGLAYYLVKPADGRACMPKRDEYISDHLLREDREAAAEYWLEADEARKAGRFGKCDRLPRMYNPCCGS